MSTANPVPETFDLTGSDAKETLERTGRLRLLRDAFERLRASDGFSHARSMAFLTALILVQGVIALVGLASALGSGRVSEAIVGMLKEVFPGPAGVVLTDAVKQAHEAGSQSRSLALTLGLIGAIVTGTILLGQIERAMNRLYGVEQDRPTTKKYGRAFVLTLSAGLLAVVAFIAMTLGRSAGSLFEQPLGSRRLERPPLAARLRLPDRRDRVRVPVEPASSPTRVVLAGDRRPRVGHLRAHRDDGAQRLLPAQLDVRSDLRTARRVRGPAAVDHAELDRPPVRGRRRRAARSRTCRGPLATTTHRVRRSGFRGSSARRSVATRHGQCLVSVALDVTQHHPASQDRTDQIRRTLEGVLGVPATEGNLVEVLRNGNEIFPAMLGAIAEADHTIDLLTFVYWRGQIGTRFAEALSERAGSGVRVRVLLDAWGAHPIDRELIGMMEDAGVRLRWFRPLHRLQMSKANHRTHRKVMVVDEAVGFTGGVGIADEWNGDARNEHEWRDTHFRVHGPAVDGLRAAFLDNWIETDPEIFTREIDRFPDQPKPGRSVIQCVRGASETGASDMSTLVLSLLQIAEERIRITTAYFVPDAELVDRLCAASDRGVTVEILLPGPHADKRFVQLAGQAVYESLLEHGVRIWQFQPSMLHAKVMTIDGRVANVGSANFNARSTELDEEINMVALDPDLVRAPRRSVRPRPGAERGDRGGPLGGALPRPTSARGPDQTPSALPLKGVRPSGTTRRPGPEGNTASPDPGRWLVAPWSDVYDSPPWREGRSDGAAPPSRRRFGPSLPPWRSRGRGRPGRTLRGAGGRLPRRARTVPRHTVPDRDHRRVGPRPARRWVRRARDLDGAARLQLPPADRRSGADLGHRAPAPRVLGRGRPHVVPLGRPGSGRPGGTTWGRASGAPRADRRRVRGADRRRGDPAGSRRPHRAATRRLVLGGPARGRRDPERARGPPRSGEGRARPGAAAPVPVGPGRPHRHAARDPHQHLRAHGVDLGRHAACPDPRSRAARDGPGTRAPVRDDRPADRPRPDVRRAHADRRREPRAVRNGGSSARGGDRRPRRARDRHHTAVRRGEPGASRGDRRLPSQRRC